MTRDDRVAAAGEYVLGQLAGAERQAFEQSLAADRALLQEVFWWEQRLALIGLRQVPVAPRPMVWLDIQRRVRSRVTTLPARPARLATAWAWLATAASLVLGVALYTRLDTQPPGDTDTSPAVSYVALLAVPDSSMQWSVSLTPARRQIVVRAAGEAPAAARERDAELWLITDGGPRSLGVIPKSGEQRRSYPGTLVPVAGGTLAVSLEPPGGSPTGQPTGPVVTTASVLQAG